MHECLLFATVPSNQHDHVLKILAGIAAMQPIPIKEHHLIFKPNRTTASLPISVPGRPLPASKPGSQTSAAATQANNDLFHLQLVGDLTRSRSAGQMNADIDGDTGPDSSSLVEPGVLPESHLDIPSQENVDVEMADADTSNNEDTAWSAHPWSLEFKNVPDVLGKRPATSRLTSTIPIREGSPRSFIEALGYNYVTSFVTLGNRLTHNSISIRLYRTIPLTNPLPTHTSSNPSPSVPNDEDLASLAPLDPSGGYTLEAMVKVIDGSKPELMNKAFAELTSFKETLKGIVSLEPVERLFLDTRVRPSGPGAATVVGRGTAVKV